MRIQKVNKTETFCFRLSNEEKEMLVFLKRHGLDMNTMLRNFIRKQYNLEIGLSKPKTPKDLDNDFYS